MTINAVVNAGRSLVYYGAFTANMHTDLSSVGRRARCIVDREANGIPVVSSVQI